MTIRFPALAACAAAACLCGRARAQTPTPAPADSAAQASATPARAPRRDMNLITRPEIESNGGRNAYELVTRLRPRWLRAIAASTGAAGETDPVYVYLDGARVGPAPRELYRITAEQIAELRYIPSQEAVARWGGYHSSGVISSPRAESRRAERQEGTGAATPPCPPCSP